MKKAQAFYLTALSLASVAVLTATSLSITPKDWYLLLALTGVVSLSIRLVLMNITGEHRAGRFDFGAGGAMVAILVGGPSVALLAVAIGSALTSLLKRSPLRSIIFNANSVVWSSIPALGIFHVLGGVTGARFAHPVQAVVMGAAFMVTNALLYAIFLHCAGRSTIPGALRALLSSDTVRAYVTITGMGILLSFAYLQGGPSWGLLVVGLAYLIHSALKRYFDALRGAQTHAHQLEVILNATRSAMVMTDPAGVVQVANQQVGDLFGLDPRTLPGLPYERVPELVQLGGMEDGQPERIDRVVETVRGPARFLHWYRAAVQDQQGISQGHVTVFTDVTPLKDAESNLRHVYDSMIRILTAAIDARDSYTHGHSERVSSYSVGIAKRMGLSDRDLERIRYAGLLHDIGKVGIDDHVLRKHGALTPSERALMMEHPVIGAEVLQKADVLADLLPGVRWHHEWISGGGYPDGLKGDEIPLDARIIGVADALDAMTSDRPYRPALPLAEALKRIEANIGVQFDHAVAYALFDSIDDGTVEIGTAERSHSEVVAPSDAGVIRPVHGKELALFYELARADYAAQNLHAVLHHYLATIRTGLGPHTFLIFLIDPETGKWRAEASVGLDDPATAAFKDLRLLQEAADLGAPVVVGDVLKLVGYRSASAASRTEAVIPLISQGEVLGALVVEAGLPHHFSRDDLYLLEALGQRLCSSVRLVRYHEQLAFAATHDGLTGTFNHNYFYERLTEEAHRSSRVGSPVSLLLIDLVGLKAVNDTYGHVAGNDVLRAYGSTLRDHVQPGYLVARYGGDEFAVILPEASRSDARRQCAKLMKALRRSFVVEGVPVPLPRASCGIATAPENGGRAAELVYAAERDMERRRQARPRSVTAAPESARFQRKS